MMAGYPSKMVDLTCVIMLKLTTELQFKVATKLINKSNGHLIELTEAEWNTLRSQIATSIK